MSWITVIWAMGASACLTLAAMYFSVWVRNRAQAHQLFAMTAASLAVYALFELRVMFAQTPQQLDAALRWAQVPLSLGLLALIGFVWAYLGAGRPWLAWTIVGLRTIFVLPSLLMGGNPTLREIPSLRQMRFLGESVTLNQGIPGPWALIGSLTVLLTLIFVADASITAWRQGDRRKALMVGGTVQFFLLAGLGTSLLVSWAGFTIPPANSLYYQGLVVVMGYELSREAPRASQLAHDLRTIEARSHAILRAVPDLMFLQSMDGVYLDYHTSRPDHLLIPPENFLGKNMREVLPPDVLRAIAPAFREAATAAEPVMVEYELPMPHGQRVYEARLVRNDSEHILTVIRDVTDRRQAEDALRESQQRYTLATAAGAVGVWDWNLETNEIYVDPKLKSILGFDDAEIPNRIDDWGSHVYADDVPAVMAQAQRCIDGEIEVYEVAHRMVHKDGSLRWFLARGSLVNGRGSVRRLVGTDIDITERKQAEELIRESRAVLEANHREIQDLAGRLITSQDAERARIARDLHDDLSQQIAGLSIELSGLKRRLSAVAGAGELPGQVASLQLRTFDLAESLRSLSHDLHPGVLRHAGLVAALAAHCAHVERQQTVVVSFTADGDFASLTPAAALCLYRVAQEGLRNIVTHAKAAHAEVHLARSGDQAELVIADDGRGFAIADATTRGSGLGLVSINERVRLAGGAVSIVTEVHKGTRLRVTIPANGHGVKMVDGAHNISSVL